VNDTIKLPYGKTGISLELPVGTYSILQSRIEELRSDKSGIEIVREAMRNPWGGKTLKELAEGKKNATIILSDHTRPVPSKDIIPLMLQEMRHGNPNIEITLLVATGSHRGTTVEELTEKLGEDIVRSEQIVIHDCLSEDNVEVGVLPSGAKFMVNRVAVETELLVSEGFIEPHFFAGFSGGRKSVFPGVCARKTVLGNHCSAFIDHPCSRTGILDGNPIHQDMVYAARKINLSYIVNVVIDKDKKTVAAFAGDMETAHEKGCEFLSKYCTVQAKPADIVITTNGGAPMDQNVYQSVKGLTAAEASAKEDAILIMCAALADGTGGDDFYRALKECESPAALYREIQKIPQDETKQDQWEYQILARILIKHQVIFVTEKENQKIIEDMKMIYAPNIETALKLAQGIKGEKASLTIIPDGVSVVVRN
jgi:nickel-dependent lactate racemase